MTIILNLSQEAEARLELRAKLAGRPLSELITDIVEQAAQEGVPNLLDEMRSLGVIGAVHGSAGPGDGRAWSEIEAACDPL